ncbi:hypothetical protein VP01_781g2 [Puccinia sorghi]|uniref:Uncharacterized protein n=1 Tax=Puccinia sorghi TaxID=27349 RepID=A0A0L6UB32_9BASI|nr:hypothetical protein VP01_781g2 [Puccinia sorghi]
MLVVFMAVQTLRTTTFYRSKKGCQIVLVSLSASLPAQTAQLLSVSNFIFSFFKHSHFENLKLSHMVTTVKLTLSLSLFYFFSLPSISLLLLVFLALLLLFFFLFISLLVDFLEYIILVFFFFFQSGINSLSYPFPFSATLSAHPSTFPFSLRMISVMDDSLSLSSVLPFYLSLKSVYLFRLVTIIRTLIIINTNYIYIQLRSFQEKNQDFNFKHYIQTGLGTIFTFGVVSVDSYQCWNGRHRFLRRSWNGRPRFLRKKRLRSWLKRSERVWSNRRVVPVSRYGRPRFLRWKRLRSWMKRGERLWIRTLILNGWKCWNRLRSLSLYVARKLARIMASTSLKVLSLQMTIGAAPVLPGPNLIRAVLFWGGVNMVQRVPLYSWGRVDVHPELKKGLALDLDAAIPAILFAAGLPSDCYDLTIRVPGPKGPKLLGIEKEYCFCLISNQAIMTSDDTGMQLASSATVTHGPSTTFFFWSGQFYSSSSTYAQRTSIDHMTNRHHNHQRTPHSQDFHGLSDAICHSAFDHEWFLLYLSSLYCLNLIIQPITPSCPGPSIISFLVEIWPRPHLRLQSVFFFFFFFSKSLRSRFLKSCTLEDLQNLLNTFGLRMATIIWPCYRTPLVTSDNSPGRPDTLAPRRSSWVHKSQPPLLGKLPNQTTNDRAQKIHKSSPLLVKLNQTSTTRRMAQVKLPNQTATTWVKLPNQTSTTRRTAQIFKKNKSLRFLKATASFLTPWDLQVHKPALRVFPSPQALLLPTPQALQVLLHILQALVLLTTPQVLVLLPTPQALVALPSSQALPALVVLPGPQILQVLPGPQFLRVPPEASVMETPVFHQSPLRLVVDHLHDPSQISIGQVKEYLDPFEAYLNLEHKSSAVDTQDLHQTKTPEHLVDAGDINASVQLHPGQTPTHLVDTGDVNALSQLHPVQITTLFHVRFSTLHPCSLLCRSASKNLQENSTQWTRINLQTPHQHLIIEASSILPPCAHALTTPKTSTPLRPTPPRKIKRTIDVSPESQTSPKRQCRTNPADPHLHNCLEKKKTMISIIFVYIWPRFSFEFYKPLALQFAAIA